MTLNALDRHVALIGFMGAGKTTLAGEVASRLERTAIDADRLIEGRVQVPLGEFFAKRGELEFRVVEAAIVGETLRKTAPAVIALGGGAVKTASVRKTLAEPCADRARRGRRGHGLAARARRATVHSRRTKRRSAGCTRSASRSIARRRTRSRTTPTGWFSPRRVSTTSSGRSNASASSCPGTGAVALVTDSTVMGIHGAAAQTALGDRLVSTHELPRGEEAKQLQVVERLWSELTLDRAGTVVALGGGSLTDAAGLAAALYLRGVPWVAVPTTLVGQVDAGIGGKTAIDIPQGKNLVGAFHWPARVVIDEALLATLPERERRQGEAERIKTELLAGRTLDVRGAAAYKAALCLRDPHDRGPRQWLNLGHTFAHALEAAADFDLPHGEAVALGLLAALRLSGRDPAPVVVGARPAARRGRPRARLGGAAAGQETERRDDQPRAPR